MNHALLLLFYLKSSPAISYLIQSIIVTNTLKQITQKFSIVSLCLYLKTFDIFNRTVEHWFIILKCKGKG